MLLFIKSPERGMVKSRLAKYLDEDVVLSLYKYFVLDLLETVRKGRYPLKICFSPPHARKKVSDWLGKDYSYMPQKGKDLGERMKNAFWESFSEGFSKVVLIGSDIPDLTNTVMDEAFTFDGYDAAIGPAFDGGYYLVGFQKHTFLPRIFEGMTWGAKTVFQKTMEIFKTYHYRVHVLPKWQDVDRLGDLSALFQRNRDTDFANSRTIALLTRYKHIFQ